MVIKNLELRKRFHCYYRLMWKIELLLFSSFFFSIFHVYKCSIMKCVSLNSFESKRKPEFPTHAFNIIHEMGNYPADYVSIYSPICIDTATHSGSLFLGETICTKSANGVSVSARNCSNVDSTYRNFSLIRIEPQLRSVEWLRHNRENISWINQPTILQTLTDDCQNIAHFTRRILCLFHIIQNYKIYSPNGQRPSIITMPEEQMSTAFVHPHTFNMYISGFFDIVISPHKAQIGTFHDVIARSSKTNDSFVQVINRNTSPRERGSTFDKKFICFQHGIVPNYMRGRFFVNHSDYVMRSSNIFPAEAERSAVHVPKDSISFREKVSAILNENKQIYRYERVIKFLDRSGTKKRLLFPESRRSLTAVIENEARANGFEFEICDFQKMKFLDQCRSIKNTSIAVGIHGANLVNTMFMPPMAVLLEIFPFGFHHEKMYVNGGNSGLKYYSYTVKEGNLYSGAKNFTSIDLCIRKNQSCHHFYRDAAVKICHADLVEVRRIIKEAIMSITEVIKSSSM